MKNKLIPLIAVFIAMVAAAGCMGFPNAGFDLSSASQDISTGRVPSESRIAYAGEAASRPIPTSALSEPGSGISGIDSKIIKTAYLTIEVKDVHGSIESLNPEV